MDSHGLFVGLVTLDLVYQTAGPPSNNQKIVASDYTVSAGGPATNAAVTFAHLGNQAKLLGVVGQHPIHHLIRADLADYQVAIADLNPTYSEPPPVSSIIVTQTTGERAIVSLNARKSQAASTTIPSGILQGVDIVLIDGHQIEVGQAIAQLAQANKIPVILDGGSWKPGLEKVLPYVNYAVCSADFRPPDCQGSAQILNYLSDIGIPQIAITHGGKPIEYVSPDQAGWLEVPQVRAVDTLGAGDVFHGAFCHYILQGGFATALTQAATVATKSCQYFGTRRWLQAERLENN